MTGKRREELVRLVNQRGQLELKKLAKEFGVSEMTLRRDMAYLEEKGEIIRTRGGAIAAGRFTGLSEELFSSRSLTNVAKKALIAEKALPFAEPGRSIFIDSGTTTMLLAKALPDEYYYIITAGPNIALEAARTLKPNITLIGGNLNRNNLSASGVHSLDFIRDINIDIAFMAASGFGLDTGFMAGAFSECELKQAVIKKANRVIMLMDSSKAEKRMPFTFARLEDIDILVTDDQIDDTIMEKAKAVPVTIV